MFKISYIKPFLATVRILYPLENTRKLLVSGVSRGIKWKYWPELG